jgi:hypothetical protein
MRRIYIYNFKYNLYIKLGFKQQGYIIYYTTNSQQTSLLKNKILFT